MDSAAWHLGEHNLIAYAAMNSLISTENVGLPVEGVAALVEVALALVGSRSVSTSSASSGLEDKKKKCEGKLVVLRRHSL